MQGLGKFNFKINTIPERMNECMSFNINNDLTFIDSLQFLRFFFDSLVQNLGKYDFKYLS